MDRLSSSATALRLKAVKVKYQYSPLRFMRETRYEYRISSGIFLIDITKPQLARMLMWDRLNVSRTAVRHRHLSGRTRFAPVT